VVDRMDRMPDGSLEIHDYKTGGRLPGQAEMDTDRQLALYNLAVRDRWKDAGDVKLVWHFLQFGTELRSSRTPRELEDASAACASLIKTIEGTAEFRPAPGPLCDWCGYWEHCPEKKHLVKIGSLPPAEAAAEDGFALVNEYARLKGEERRISAGTDTLRERLLEYSKRENATRIRGSTAAVTVRTQEAPYLPGRPADGPAYEELVNALKQAGAWERYSVADSKALLEALREGKLDPALARELEPLVQERSFQIVRLGRLKEEED